MGLLLLLLLLLLRLLLPLHGRATQPALRTANPHHEEAAAANPTTEAKTRLAHRNSNFPLFPQR